MENQLLSLLNFVLDKYEIKALSSRNKFISYYENLIKEYKFNLFVKDLSRFKAPHRDIFLKELKNTRPFILHDNGGGYLKSSQDNKTQELDIPFKTCFFENYDCPLVVYQDYKEGFTVTLGMWVHELSPKQYIFICLDTTLYPNGNIYTSLFSYDDINDFNAMTITKKSLDFLSNCCLGEGKTRVQIKTKENGIKCINKIKKVIHVIHKKNVSLLPKGLNIDWSHKWEVMGHWRKINTIGKDREDNYNIKGYTWIKNYTKGSGELIRKIRIKD